MNNAVCKWILRIAATSIVAALGLPLPCQAEAFQAKEIAAWLDRDLAEIVELSIGPEGAKIFPVWTRESGEPQFAAILLLADSDLDIGTVAPAQLQIYFDPSTLKPYAVAFELEEALRLEQVTTYFAMSPDLRSCRPAASDVAVDAPLVRVDEGQGTVAFAVFPEIRLVAEMLNGKGYVTRLRWVTGAADLSGCP